MTDYHTKNHRLELENILPISERYAKILFAGFKKDYDSQNKLFKVGYSRDSFIIQAEYDGQREEFYFPQKGLGTSILKSLNVESGTELVGKDITLLLQNNSFVGIRVDDKKNKNRSKKGIK